MVEETCTGAFYEAVQLNVCACVRTLFLCGDISSLIRAHLLRVFSLLQKHTHAHEQNPTISKFSLLRKTTFSLSRGRCMVEEGIKRDETRSGDKKDKGKL